MTRDQALEILDSGEFERFIGATESLEVEFKGEPYRLEAAAQKFELAKDVSALANAAGGVIVVGARTASDDATAVDVVTAIRSFDRDLVNTTQYEDTIGERIYPRLREIHARFFAIAGDEERGVVAIDVPPQLESDRYFLIQKPMDEGSDRIPGWLVGLAIRGIGRVEVRQIAEIHAIISRGLNFGGQLVDIAEAVAELREADGITSTDIPEAPAELRDDAASGIAPTDSPADRLADVIESRVDEVER
jgi:hypothetical protein